METLTVPRPLFGRASVVQLLRYFVQRSLAGRRVIHGIQLNVRMVGQQADDLNISLRLNQIGVWSWLSRGTGRLDRFRCFCTFMEAKTKGGDALLKLV